VHEDEQQSRREAVRRVLAAEPVAAVAADLGRSKPWVRKWVARYDPTDESWACSHSRAPRTVANRTDEETESLVLKVRRQLAAEPWAQLGASAIAWELTKLGIDDPPPPRTIERILARHDEPRRARRGRYTPKGTAYPAPPMLEPNACQQGDTVGPRHLEGGELFYVFNVVDVGRRKAAGQICASKSAESTCTALMAIWDRLGLPQRLQLDNQQALAGAGRRPGLVARACLANGVTPTYIPFAEPWRNGVVEHFNDTFDKKFFRTERFASPTELIDRYDAFETFHNANHRYSALKGATPNHIEARAGFTPQPPTYDNDIPPDFTGLTGQVEWIRLIRSDKQLRVLDHRFTMPDELTYEYVTATLIVEDQELVVTHQDREISRHPYPLR
jgi:putative transposase